MTKYELVRLRYIAADRRLIEQLQSITKGNQISQADFQDIVKELAVARRAMDKVKKTKLSLEYFWAFTML